MTRAALAIALCACGQPAADPKRDPCSAAALGLEAAKPLVAWKLPADCTAKGSPSPAILANAADVRAQLACKDANAKLGVDFTRQALVVTTGSWSPAQTGLVAFDDGKTVTLVSRQRAPCPKDPHPVPTPAITSWFVTGTGARAFANASCTVPTKCP